MAIITGRSVRVFIGAQDVSRFVNRLEITAAPGELVTTHLSLLAAPAVAQEGDALVFRFDGPPGRGPVRIVDHAARAIRVRPNGPGALILTDEA